MPHNPQRADNLPVQQSDKVRGGFVVFVLLKFFGDPLLKNEHVMSESIRSLHRRIRVRN
jgi:hypothetical protein